VQGRALGQACEPCFAHGAASLREGLMAVRILLEINGRTETTFYLGSRTETPVAAQDVYSDPACSISPPFFMSLTYI